MDIAESKLRVQLIPPEVFTVEKQ